MIDSVSSHLPSPSQFVFNGYIARKHTLGNFAHNMSWLSIHATHIHSIMWLCARFPCRSACVCVCLCVFANVSFVFCVYVARDFYEWTDVTCVVKLKKKFAGNKYACCLYNRMMWNTTTAKMASIFFLSLLLSWLQYTHIHQQCTTIYMCNVIHNMICAPNGMYIVELCT